MFTGNVACGKLYCSQCSHRGSWNRFLKCVGQAINLLDRKLWVAFWFLGMIFSQWFFAPKSTGSCNTLSGVNVETGANYKR